MKKISKKIIVILSLFGLLSCITIYVWLPTKDTQPCTFCNPQIIQTHTFYEDDLVRGLCTHKPILPYHCLIVIKRHIAKIEDATENEMSAAFRLIKRINAIVQKINGPSSYMLLQKNGAEVGQTVPHVHIHYIPKKESDHKSLATFGLLWHFVLSPFQRPISKKELAERVEKMKDSCNTTFFIKNHRPC